MSDELAGFLVETLRDRPSSTARALASLAGLAGHQVDKSAINSVLYRRSDLFGSNGAVPPAWSLVHHEAPEVWRTPYRVGGMFVENWKAFEHASVVFRGVTLVFGENSSGKSSLFQALRLMKQSWGYGDFQLEPFGWYEHVVHQHDIARPMNVGASWVDPENDDQWWVSLRAVSDVDSLVFNPEHPLNTVALNFPGGQLVVARRNVDDSTWVGSWKASSASRESEGVRVEVGVDGAGFPDPDVSLEIVGVDVSEASVRRMMRKALDGAGELFASLEFLPAVREVPPRDISLEWAAVNATYLTDLFVDRGDLKLEVNEWLQRFEVPYSVSIEMYGDDDGDEQFELSLTRDGPSGEKVQLRDVGFGVSQLLPIIVELLANREKTILIEEPEAHVHPRLQSVLGDLFITSNQDYGNVVIVETHSEPLLLRLQRRVAEQRIVSDDVCVMHVVRDGSSAEVRHVSIQDDGRLDYQWPGGFFDNRMDDLIAIFDPR